MKSEIFQDQQQILVSDLSRAQTDKEQSIKERELDLQNPGVVIGSQLLGEGTEFRIDDTSAGSPRITVNTGVAISPIGERTLINSVFTFNAANPSMTSDNGLAGTTPTPQSTGSQNIPLTPSTTNYIWLGYLDTIDPSVYTLAKNPPTQKLYVKGDDGFQIMPTTSSNDPDFPSTNTHWTLIGIVITTGIGVSSISATSPSRKFSSTKNRRIGISIPPDNTLRPAHYDSTDVNFLDDHINAIGSGPITGANPHGTDFPDLNGQVVNAQLATNSVAAAQLQTNSVSTVKVQNGAITLAKLSTDSVGSPQIIIADGTTGQDVTTGTGVKTTHIQDGAVTSTKLDPTLFNTIAPVGNSIKSNLSVQNSGVFPNTTVRISADILSAQNVVINSGNPFSTSANITISGPGGLDVGSASVSPTWYAVFVICNPAGGAYNGLLSTSPTSPVVPAGFKFRRVGWFRWTGAAFYKQILIGDKVYYDDATAQPIVSVTAGSWSFASSIPPTSLVGIFSVEQGGGGIHEQLVNPTGSSVAPIIALHSSNTAGVSITIIVIADLRVSSSQSIDVNSTGTLQVYGYVDPI